MILRSLLIVTTSCAIVVELTSMTWSYCNHETMVWVLDRIQIKNAKFQVSSMTIVYSKLDIFETDRPYESCKICKGRPRFKGRPRLFETGTPPIQIITQGEILKIQLRRLCTL